MKTLKNFLNKYNSLDFLFFFKQNINDKKIINMQQKNTLITSEYINHNINVYNGNLYKKVIINYNMLNNILGCFILTKRKSSEIHKKKTKKNKKK